MWRPKGWINKYSVEHYKNYLPFAKRDVDPLDVEWSLEDCEIAFETGADAMYPYALEKGKAEGKKELLEALRKEGIKSEDVMGIDMTYHCLDIPTIEQMRKTQQDIYIKGKWVFIPEEVKK